MSKYAKCCKCGKEAVGIGKGWEGSGVDICNKCSTPKSTSVGELTVKISVDTSELDAAIEKVEKLTSLLMSVDPSNFYNQAWKKVREQRETHQTTEEDK